MILGRSVPSDIYKGASAPEAPGLWALYSRNSTDCISLSGSISCICHWLWKSRASWSGWLPLAISPDFDCSRWVGVWRPQRIIINYTRCRHLLCPSILRASLVSILEFKNCFNNNFDSEYFTWVLRDTRYWLWPSLLPCSSRVPSSRRA